VAGPDGAFPPSSEALARSLSCLRCSPSLARRQSLLVALGITAAVAACIVLGFGWGSFEQAGARLDLSVDGIERIAEAWGAWAPVVSIALMILHSFVPFPAELIAIANGMLFGPVWGTLVTWIGAMLGAALAFALARRYGRPLVDRLVARQAWTGAEALHACCDARTLLLARLVPVISFNLINCAAGVLDVGWWRFLWTTSIGILPITVASVTIGSQLTGPIWDAWLAGSSLLLVLYLGWRWYAARRLRARRDRSAGSACCRPLSCCHSERSINGREAFPAASSPRPSGRHRGLE
jgi:uncharacterized membrane protein YdjX (TVP38/TMEM64 family)